MVFWLQYHLQYLNVYTLLVDRYKFSCDFFVLCNDYLVHKITERHQLLEETVLARDDETDAYNMAHHLNYYFTPIFLTSLVLETVSFFLYTNMVTQNGHRLTVGGVKPLLDLHHLKKGVAIPFSISRAPFGAKSK